MADRDDVGVEVGRHERLRACAAREGAPRRGECSGSDQERAAIDGLVRWCG